MFYSHEILTSPKHGVATIWVVATLGSKSGFKKITRKAILDVDVPSACNTIVGQDEPLALRLQGSLLYGVSKVYSQQCGYVLSDTQAIRDRMKYAISLIKTAKDTGLDPSVGKARLEHLNIAEGETILPDILFNFDPNSLDTFDVPQSNLASMLSIHSTIAPSDDLPMLDLGSMSTPGGIEEMGGFGLGGDSSSIQLPDSKASHISLLDNPRELLPKTLAFDDDFNITDIFGDVLDDVEAEARPNVGDGIAQPSGQVLDKSQGETTAQDIEPMDVDEDILLLGEDYPLLAMSHQTTEAPQAGVPSAESEHETSSTVEAPQRRQRGPAPIRLDLRQELTNDVLRAWNEDYRENMANASRIRQVHRDVFVARKNGAYFVFGQGIGGIGAGIGHDKIRGPLAQLSGFELIADLLQTPSRKRALSRSVSSEEESRQKRMRSVERQIEDEGISLEGITGEVARATHEDGIFDDTGIMVFGDEDVEVGREAPSSLPDRRQSSLPWNVSASRYGSGRIGSGLPSSSLAAGRGGMDLGSFPILGRRSSRMMSSSPLGGRGASIGRLSQLNIPTHQSSAGHEYDLDSSLRSPDDATDEYLRQPTDSQTVVAALDTESYNFLAFVAADIEASHEEANISVDTSTTFDKLLPPNSHSKDVAAQGFLHILTLATKGLIVVTQDEEGDEIRIRIVEE